MLHHVMISRVFIPTLFQRVNWISISYIYITNYTKVLKLVTYYPLYTGFICIDVHNLKRWCYRYFKITSIIIESKILLLCDQLIYSNSKRVYVKFQLRNYYDHSLLEYTFLWSPKETQCFNLHKISGASIENIYCHPPLSIMIHSIRNIWLLQGLIRKSKSLQTLTKLNILLRLRDHLV